jgi:hypothetical protein
MASYIHGQAIVRTGSGHIVGGGAGTAELEIVDERIRVFVHDVVRFAQATIELPGEPALAALRDPITATLPLRGEVRWSRMGVPLQGEGEFRVLLLEQDSRDVAILRVQIGGWSLEIVASRADLQAALDGLGGSAR